MQLTDTQKLYGLLRIAMGLIFLWAFIDKLWGLGFATPAEKSWIAGGSPTYGFLAMASKGPFANFYHTIAGAPSTDWLFMLGLLGLGLAFTLGIGMRIATVSGSLFVLLLYSAVLPPANNPILDEHIIYLLVILLLGAVDAGQYWGLGKQWSETNLVKKIPLLR